MSKTVRIMNVLKMPCDLDMECAEVLIFDREKVIDYRQLDVGMCQILMNGKILTKSI